MNNKINLILILLFNFASFSTSDLLDLSLVKNLVKEINKLTGGIWESGVTPFSLLPINKQKQLCGAKFQGNDTQAEPPKIVEKDPTCSCEFKIEFDARTKWPSCRPIIDHIQHQGQCGSCWSVSTASAFTDRTCIERSKKGQNTNPNDANQQFSALDLFTCSINYNGCNGGNPFGAWSYIKNKGICTGTDFNTKNGCKPYPYSPSSPPTQKQCTSSCTNSMWKIPYLKDKHMAKSAGNFRGSQGTVQAIQNEIRNNGPVVACFDVYSDFMTYRSGVYFKTANAQKRGGHAVVLLGWGTYKCGTAYKMDFWLAKNSWGKEFGEQGYFKIRRGVNECGIEKAEISFGVPKI